MVLVGRLHALLAATGSHWQSHPYCPLSGCNEQVWFDHLNLCVNMAKEYVLTRDLTELDLLNHYASRESTPLVIGF